MSFDFRETTIKAVATDLDGYTIYVGNGSGDLASVDIRTGWELHEHLTVLVSSSCAFYCLVCSFAPNDWDFGLKIYYFFLSQY